MFSAFTWGCGAAPGATEQEDPDAAYARSLQEQEDAELAHRTAAASMVTSMLGGGGAFPPSLLGWGAARAGTASLQPGDLVPPPLDQAESPHVACEMADRAVEMLVDTGAQCSVISMPLVRQFNLESRLDSRQQGVASGVGQARILGRLRGIPVKMGHVEFSLDFSVLEIDQPLLILGVDQMRRFRCVVDLDKQMLLFGGRDGIEVPFLPEPQQSMSYRSMGGCPQM